MTQISDYFPQTPEYPNIIGLRAINKVGEYVKNEVQIISVITPANVYATPNMPYAGKITAYLTSWSAELEQEDREELLRVLKDSSAKFNTFITTIETLMQTTNTAALAQYNTIVPPSTVPKGPTPPYVPVGWNVALISALQDTIKGEFSQAVQDFVDVQYSSLGQG